MDLVENASRQGKGDGLKVTSFMCGLWFDGRNTTPYETNLNHLNLTTIELETALPSSLLACRLALGFQVYSFEFEVVSCELPVASCELRAASCEQFARASPA